MQTVQQQGTPGQNRAFITQTVAQPVAQRQPVRAVPAQVHIVL